MKYVILENNQPKTIVQVKGFVPANSISCPQGARDVSELTVVTIDGQLVAQLDPIKIAEYDAKLAADQAKQDQAAQLQKKRARLDFGMQLKAEVMLINDTKTWDQLTWQNYINNEHIRSLSALLVDGYLQTALNLLQSADLSQFYDASEVQTIANKIQNYLAAE